MDNRGRSFSVTDDARISVSFIEEDSAVVSSSCHTGISFNNQTSQTIHVKSRLGVKTSLRPKKDNLRFEKFQVLLEWRMSADMFKQALYDLNMENVVPDLLTGAVIRAFEQRSPRAGHKDCISAYIVVDITLEQLRGHDGAIYLEDLDLLVHLDMKQHRHLNHPYSREERTKRALGAEIPYLGADTFVMSIKAVDNSPLKKYAERFFQLGSDVYHIPIEEDDRLDTGVWITTRQTAESKNEVGSTQRVHTSFMPFETADKVLGLADTIEKARFGADQEALHKFRLNERKHSQTIEEMNRREKLIRQEAEQAEAKGREQARRSTEDLRKEHARGVGEWIRLIGSLITGAFSLATVVAKLKPA